MFDGGLAQAVVVRAGEVPAGDGWLGPRERLVQSGLRLPRRAAEWRAGRWAAKSAVARRLGIEPAGLEILAGPSGAPQAWTGTRRPAVNVSISHRDGCAFAVATPEAVEPGCDLELVEPRSPAFVEDWFTPRERSAVDGAAPGDRDELVTLIWSAKESVLKALHTGLRVDVRRVEVSARREDFDAEMDGERIHGWWKRDGRFVITAAALERTR
jgi:4'-phosphopantetheinyl transferase